LNKLLDIFFPKKCLGCGQANTYFCLACFNQIKLNPNDNCFFCKKPTIQGNICIECKKQTYLDKIITATEYTLVKNLIKKFKYQYIKELNEPLSQLLIESIKEISKNVIIIPIPLHKIRQRKRGFNQAELLAKNVSKYFNVPMYVNILKRNKHTEPQANIKNTEKRKENLKNVFEIENKELIKNKTIIIIDDVITTGATIIQAAKILEENKAKEIYGLMVAKG